MQNRGSSPFEFCIAEAPRDLSKIAASRAQCKIGEARLLNFDIAEAPRDLSKIAASRAQCKIKTLLF